MSLPTSLIAEVRLAFRVCARRNPYKYYRCFSTTLNAYDQHKSPAKKSDSNSKPSKLQPKVSRPPLTPVSSIPANCTSSTRPGDDVGPEKTLVPREEKKGAIDTVRRVNVPLRVIPRAELSPDVKLSPTQRLHIEMLTRRAPQQPQRRIYKNKLLIYHFGSGKEVALVFSKCASITIALFIVSAIVVPAHYSAGSPLWLIAAIFVGGWTPVVLLHQYTKTWVSRVFLHLPSHARQSPQAAMEYAKNLPANSQLDIEFFPLVPISRKISTYLTDLVPASGGRRPVTFKWTGPRVEAGSFWSSNPTEFFVNAKSSPGKAARMTIPGIWSTVYRRLAGVESQTASKWKR